MAENRIDDYLQKERQRIGGAIRQRRECMGLSQDQLAERTGLKRQNIARIEHGRHSIGLDILNRVSLVLGMRIYLRDAE